MQYGSNRNVYLLLSERGSTYPQPHSLQTAPEAEENMSYGMPAYKLLGKPLVYFAAYPHHIGFYATPTGHEKFADELAAYKQGKGSVQFPLDKPIPYDLIERIVAFRVQENRAMNK